MKRQLLIFSILLFTFFIANAQSDYIVTLKGDTVLGEIRSKNNDWVKFKENRQSKFIKLPSSGIQSVYVLIYDEYFAYKVVIDGGKLLLLQRLDNGLIKLYDLTTYSYSKYGSSKYVKWYAEKEDSPLVEIKTNSFFGSKEARKNAFVSLISDQPSIVDIFNKEEKFNFKFIQGLIQQYNSLAQSQ
ncbi:MAG: hypothetical protein H7Y07_09360 [Pyrinomonadaceae bacterium]|nr:hypothetical protein [Sphingobacteriaceae bacterium]